VTFGACNLLLAVMKRFIVLGACLILVSSGAVASGPFTSLHPEEAIPDPVEKPSQGPHMGFISRVQERLRALGFDAGPVNGDFGEKTQAALAQFQLSAAIPAGGQLDDRTLAELGVARQDGEASAGASGASAPSASPASATPQSEISSERTAEPGRDERKPEPGTGEKPAS